MALLIEKGLASQEQVERLEDTGISAVGRRRIKFVQVDDVRVQPFSGESHD